MKRYQFTLDGKPVDTSDPTWNGRVDGERERPRTLMWCVECEDHILRSRRFDHPDDHDIIQRKPGSKLQSEPDSESSNPAEGGEVGHLFEVSLSYSADFVFRVPAHSKHTAEEVAEDLVDYPSNCGDMYKMHSTTRKLTDLSADDDRIPDDWDPYGSTPLWEVFGNSSDDDDDGGG